MFFIINNNNVSSGVISNVMACFLGVSLIDPGSKPPSMDSPNVGYEPFRRVVTENANSVVRLQSKGDKTCRKYQLEMVLVTAADL